MMIKLELSDNATVGDLITKLFPDMEFRDNAMMSITNYFGDIKIKRNTWDEKLDWDRLKESGILAEEQEPILDKIRAEIEQAAFMDVNGSKYIFVNRVNQIFDNYRQKASITNDET